MHKLTSLFSFLSPDQWLTSPQDLLAYASDKWHASQIPQAVCLPTDTQQVAAIMRTAHAHRIPITPRGTGTGHAGGCVPEEGGVVLSLEKMNRILEISPQDGVGIAQAGVLTGDFQQAVAKQGWYYPPDPASLKECTIGGNVATNAGGPRCLKYGVTKHFVLGLCVVLSDGTILHTGGRTHKNVTGFDLTDLFVGSEGLLGIVTEVTMRLIPHPQSRGMLGASFPTFSHAAQAVQSILDAGWLPSALEITDGFTMQAARDYLGSQKLPQGDAYLMVEVDGSKENVFTQLPLLERMLQKNHALRIDIAPDEEACEAIWQLRRDFSYSLKHTGLTKLNEDIVVPRSQLVALVDFATSLQEETGLPIACFGHAGDGNIHTNIMVEDYKNPDIKQKADKALDRLFDWVIAHKGAISGEHGIGLAKKRWFGQAIGEDSLRIQREIKSLFDPRGVLNGQKFLS